MAKKVVKNKKSPSKSSPKPAAKKTVAKSAAKKPVQKSVKKPVKKPVKKLIDKPVAKKQVAKQVTKKATKKVAKAVVKKTAAKAVIKSSAKSQVKKAPVKKVAKAVAKPAVKKLIKKPIAKPAAKPVAKSASVKAVLTAAIKAAKPAVKKPVAKPVVKAIVKVQRLTPAPLPPAPAVELTEAQLQAVKTGLGKKEIEAYRKSLLEHRSEIVGDMQGMEATRNVSAGDLSHMPLHMADVGSDNYDQEFTLGILESERKILNEIDAALTRMDKNYYGVCLETGRPIERPRLDAMPWAKYGKEAALRREKQGY